MKFHRPVSKLPVSFANSVKNGPCPNKDLPDRYTFDILKFHRPVSKIPVSFTHSVKNGLYPNKDLPDR